MAPRPKKTDGDSQQTNDGAATAVLDPPDTTSDDLGVTDDFGPPELARTPEGYVQIAGQNVEYWFDETTTTVMGATVHMWRNDPDGETGVSWGAQIRRNLDGNFIMTYPNPGGGADYEVRGRHQLMPLIDQAVKIGTQMVLADHIP
jgi:hypothetical protein